MPADALVPWLECGNAWGKLALEDDVMDGMMMRVVALVACLMGSQLTAQDVDIPIADARVLAVQALRAGELPLAMEVARKLLEVDPDDRTALIIMAAASPQVGDPTAGWRAGARAWRVSDTDAQKYEAARLAALAAANAEHFTLATIWLRIALTAAPNDAARDQTVADARTIARRNPWSTSLSFSLVPSSNINGGAAGDELVVNGTANGNLSEDAVALAGWRASFGFATQYRLHENAESRTTVALRYQGNRVRITSDDDVPDEALTTNLTELTLRHIRALENGTISARLAAGTVDYRDGNKAAGMTEFGKYDVLRFGVDRQFAVSDNVGLALTAQRDWLQYLDTDIDAIERTILRSTATYARANSDSVSLTLGFTDSVGDNTNYTSQEWTLQGAYRWAEPIGPVSLSLNAGLKWSDYPEYELFGSNDVGRQDTTVFYGVNIGFHDVEYAGFTPGVSINGSHAQSNFSRFERDTISVGFTMRSVF
jgi:hypothetical protein